jgi:paraquat-inducible protein A
MTASNTHQQSHIVACHDCDLLVETVAIGRGQQLRCPRCRALLHVAHDNPSDNSLALAAAVAGLILFIPAVSLPLLSFELAGQSGSNTLVDGIIQLWKEGFPLLSLLVLLCSFVAPLLQLCLTTAVVLALRSGSLPRSFPLLVRTAQFFQHWSMLEVYAISILVAYVKMLSDGDVGILIGSYCLAGLLVNLVLTARYFDSEMAWRAWVTVQTTVKRSAITDSNNASITAEVQS